MPLSVRMSTLLLVLLPAASIWVPNFAAISRRRTVVALSQRARPRSVISVDNIE